MRIFVQGLSQQPKGERSRHWKEADGTSIDRGTRGKTEWVKYEVDAALEWLMTGKKTDLTGNWNGKEWNG